MVPHLRDHPAHIDPVLVNLEGAPTGVLLCMLSCVPLDQLAFCDLISRVVREGGKMPGDPKRSLPVDACVGARLKERRRILGLSQQALSDAAGLTFQQVQKYEKGVNRISASRLVQFAQVLGVEPGYFFEGAPELQASRTGEARPEDVFRVSPECARLIRAVAAIADPALRQAAVAASVALAAELAGPAGADKPRTRRSKGG